MLKESTSYDPNGIIVGNFPVQTAVATIAAGADLQPGAVLGRVTASGAYVLSAAAASNGSETPVAILLSAADAAGESAEALILLTGEVDGGRLSFGAGHTSQTVETAFRAAGRSLFIRNVTPA